MQGLVSQGEEQGRRFIKLEPKGVKHHRFQFPSHELAFQVREVVYIKLIEFDKNNDQEFQEEEIRQFLTTVLKEDGPEVHYFVKNVFRYDYNGDGIIEYDELVNFCMQQHFGEIAIQRLHRKKVYHKGQQRIMNLPQFTQTVKYALSFVDFIPQDSDLRVAFEVVDADRDGFISYQDYFRFLKEYFGSKSVAAKMVHKNSVLQQIKRSGGDRRQLNLHKKFSKNESPGNSPQKNNNIVNHTLVNKDRPLVIQPNPQQPPQPGTTSARQSVRNSIANNDRRPKPPNSSKLQLTLMNRTQKKHEKVDIVLNQKQRQICEKIVRLVLSQLKLILINSDINERCILPAEHIFNIMRNMFGYTQFMQSEMYKRGNFSRQKEYSYEQSTKIIINEHIYNIYKSLDIDATVSQKEFIEICRKICGLIKNTPLLKRYENLYVLRRQKGVFTIGQSEQLFLYIFNKCWKG